MKNSGPWMVCLGLSICCLMAGCKIDNRPGPSSLKVLSVDPADPKEVAAATAMEAARLNYDYRLSVLKGFYDSIGQAEKHQAATKELDNLRQAQWFTVVNIPEVLAPEGTNVQNVDERSLVELTVLARREYQTTLRALRDHYEYKDFAPQKADAIRRVIDRLDFVRMYSYFPEAELPPADRRPTEVIPEADELYERAYRIHWDAKFPGVANLARQREALDLFLTLVERHPSSTKIALSAYWIAEIYKEFFNENLRAVRWYERAWQWDPLITQPARFQAAVIWDLRLRDRQRALELYRQVLLHERELRMTNTATAERRIRELERSGYR